MGETIQERIQQLIDNQYNGVKRKFSQKMKIKETTVFSMFGKNTNPPFELICNIIKIHREINPYWLILGEGKMNDPLPIIDQENCEDKLESANKEIEYLKEINELLRAKK